MAKNYYEDGNTMDWTNDTQNDVKSGDLIILGPGTGVAAGDIPIGGHGVMLMTGVFDFPKEPGVVWRQGDKLYLSPNGTITNVADDGAATPVAYPFAGTAWNNAASADPKCQVRIGY